MLCILYVIALGAGLGAVGLLVERTLPPAWPRRWVWCGTIALSIAMPGLQRAYHTVDVGAAPHGLSAVSNGPPALLAPEWWAASTVLDAAIDRVSTAASAALLAWGLLSAVWVAHLSRQTTRHPGRPRASTLDAPSDATTVDGVRVVVTDRIGPATVGFLRSQVLLPRWVLALPPAQRQYVVRHEEEHRRAHDARLLGLASLFLLVTPWNVALWWHLRRLQLAVETDCDQRVVRALGNPRAYGALLLSVAEAMSHGPRLAPVLQPAFLGRVGTLERRLTTLLKPTTPTDRGRILLPLLASGLLAELLCLPHPVAGHALAHGTRTSATIHAHR